jgi:HEAT repeat protein
VDDPRARRDATVALRELAKGKDQVAVQARAALAIARDTSVRPQLTEQLGAPSSDHRKQAALGFVRLGDYGQAAAGLADDDPEVRTAVACYVLSSR